MLFFFCLCFDKNYNSNLTKFGTESSTDSSAHLSIGDCPAVDCSYGIKMSYDDKSTDLCTGEYNFTIDTNVFYKAFVKIGNSIFDWERYLYFNDKDFRWVCGITYNLSSCYEYDARAADRYWYTLDENNAIKSIEWKTDRNVTIECIEPPDADIDTTSGTETTQTIMTSSTTVSTTDSGNNNNDPTNAVTPSPEDSAHPTDVTDNPHTSSTPVAVTNDATASATDDNGDSGGDDSGGDDSGGNDDSDNGDSDDDSGSDTSGGGTETTSDGGNDGDSGGNGSSSESGNNGNVIQWWVWLLIAIAILVFLIVFGVLMYKRGKAKGQQNYQDYQLMT